MKIIAVCCGLILLTSNLVLSQELIIKGKIKCYNANENSTKGAENVVVVPAFKPSLAAVTASAPPGYFELNTGMPLSKLQDKIVTIYAISRCADCRELGKKVFISEDQDRQNRNDNKQYVTVKDWLLSANCRVTELHPLAADSVVRMVMRQPEQNLENISAASALTGAPVFLNFLSSVVTWAGYTGFPSGQFRIQSFDSGRINYGQFLLASPMILSANTGFNFSPSRDMSEAVFWNPSAIAFGRKPANVSLFTNLKNNGKLAGFFRLSKEISLGAGLIYTAQDEFRKAVYVDGFGSTLNVDTVKMKLKEYAAFVSPVYKVTNNLSIGLSAKSIWQDFNVPVSVFVEAKNDQGFGTFTDTTITKQVFEFDLSATYKISNALQFGLNLMNLAGSELYSDAFVPEQANIPVQDLRSVGLGFDYKLQRLNLGIDALFTKDGLWDAAVGANFVPFNNALISGGFAVKQMSYSLAFRIKNFRISYVNDNGWIANDSRVGKSGILNGKIYGGFVFDLD